MSDIAIRVENLSKQYRIGAQEAPRKSLREALASAAQAPFRRHRSVSRQDENTFWALDDVSFEIKQGEAVGIIGGNGAGKSTLLKILSRITKPTRGRVEMFGHLGSLLEVGTGFHTELSGRENIYLNAAILGMSRREIDRKFDEIVAFAETEKFLDTPVKYYSSGMYVRLAFAVAAHLEPDILIVDEVLAVGDTSFQKKSLGKMEDVISQGRTVLFVSHSMQAVTRLCSSIILLNRGKVVQIGASHDVVSSYLNFGVGPMAAREWEDAKQAPGNDIARLRAVRVIDEGGFVSANIDIRKTVKIEMEFDVLKEGYVLVPNFHLINIEGVHVFASSDLDSNGRKIPRPVGAYVATAWIPGNFLAEGQMMVGAALSTMDPVQVHFYERDAVAFRVTDSLKGDSARGDYSGAFPGVVRPILKWTTKYTSINKGK